jgi:hypothetical protein
MSMTGSGGSGGAAMCRSAAFNAHTYAFCDSPLVFVAAQTDCRARGMFLVRIDDAAENVWVHSMIPAADQASNNVSLWRWLGGNDLVANEDWRWDDGQAFWAGAGSGSAVNGAYTNWTNRGPNGPNSCLSMEARTASWHNMFCGNPLPYVCEQY